MLSTQAPRPGEHPIIGLVRFVASLTAIATFVVAIVLGKETLCDVTPLPYLCESPPAVHPYNEMKDEDVICVTCEIANWKAPTSPSQETWLVDLPAGKPALLQTGWCATDQETLDENWRNMHYSLTVDGHEIEEHDLHQRRETLSFREGGVCYFIAGVVDNWESGSHVYVWSHRIYEDVDDGWNTYEAGEYIMEFEVDIR